MFRANGAVSFTSFFGALPGPPSLTSCQNLIHEFNEWEDARTVHKGVRGPLQLQGCSTPIAAKNSCDPEQLKDFAV